MDDTPAITEEQARLAFHGHVVAKAQAARDAYGPVVDAEAIQRMLVDGSVVRYPTTLCFDTAGLQSHELAFAQALGFHPSDGYCLIVHPFFTERPADLVAIVAYYIPTINYGPIADGEAAELYGATLLGLETETYYEALCALADAAGLTTRHEASVEAEVV